MKTTQTHAPAIVSDGEEDTIKLDMTAKLFDMVYVDLYAHKLEAAIREIVCNAVDSHIEAGVDKPVTVIVPTSLDRTFKVVDYGLGMSPRVIVVYKTVSQTTKSLSNEVTGALGVGSKAPYAYTDSYTLTNGYNGTTTVYSIYRDMGMPKTKVLATYPSDYQGVTVSYEVAKDDLSKFRTICNNVLKEFTYPLDVQGMNLEKDVIEHTFPLGVFHEGKECVLEVTNSDSGRFGSASLVMGNIRYPTGRGRFDGQNSANFKVHVPIGSVNFMNSRETLDTVGSKRTRDFLEKIDAAVKKQADFYIAEQVKEAKNDLHRGILYRNLNTFFAVGNKRYDDTQCTYVTLPADQLGNMSVVFTTNAAVFDAYKDEYELDKATGDSVLKSVVDSDYFRLRLGVSTNRNHRYTVIVQDDKTAKTHAVKHFRNIHGVTKSNRYNHTLIWVSNKIPQEHLDTLKSHMEPVCTFLKTSEMGVVVPERKKAGKRGSRGSMAWFTTDPKGTLEELYDPDEIGKDEKFVIGLRNKPESVDNFLKDNEYTVLYTTEHKLDKVKETFPMMLDRQEALDLLVKDTGLTVEECVEWSKSRCVQFNKLPDWYLSLYRDHGATEDIDIFKRFGTHEFKNHSIMAWIESDSWGSGEFILCGETIASIRNKMGKAAPVSLVDQFKMYIQNTAPLLRHLSNWVTLSSKEQRDVLNVLRYSAVQLENNEEETE